MLFLLHPLPSLRHGAVRHGTAHGTVQVSEAKALASLRDIPPVAGKILWARQMERQLRLLSMRLSDVLGEGWENHVDGRPLKAVCDELLRNLDTKRWGWDKVVIEGGEEVGLWISKSGGSGTPIKADQFRRRLQRYLCGNLCLRDGAFAYFYVQCSVHREYAIGGPESSTHR